MQDLRTSKYRERRSAFPTYLIRGKLTTVWGEIKKSE